MIIYNFVDKFLMNDFTDTIVKILNEDKKKENFIIFDIGCFRGNFSINLKKKIAIDSDFYLFDANPELKIKNFKYENIAISDKVGTSKFNLNTFFPSSGSSLKDIIKNDVIWNITRRLFSLNILKTFKTIEVETTTIDNICFKYNINEIDVLKIDTEGSELNVLKGASKMLKNTKIILVEILDEKKNYDEKYKTVCDLLESFGFEKCLEKRILSLSIFSKCKSVDVLFKKSI